jgi:hypothetical protein
MSFEKRLHPLVVITVITLYVALIMFTAFHCHEYLLLPRGQCESRGCGLLLLSCAAPALLGVLVVAGLSFGEWLSEAVQLPPLPPQYDDERKVMLCGKSREFPYSEITVHSDFDPGIHPWEQGSIYRSKKWVYLRAGNERINLKQFKEIKQAREFAHNVRKRITVASSREPWFPPDD